MKIAKYESSPGAMMAFINRRPKTALVWDLYTFTLAGNINNGAPFVCASSDIDVRVPYSPTPVTYPCNLLAFVDYPTYNQRAGLDVDTWQVPVSPSPSCNLGGVPFLEACRAGALDGALVTVDRAMYDLATLGKPNPVFPAQPLAVVNIFTGIMGEVDFSRTGVVLNIASYISLLATTNFPRNVIARTCRWTWADAGCTLTASSFAKTGTVAGNTSSNIVTATVASPAGSGTYALGRLVMTSGANLGFTRGVKLWAQGSPATITMTFPFYYPLTAGDTFTIFPGCDKSRGQCSAFANLQHYGGFDRVPVEETAVIAG